MKNKLYSSRLNLLFANHEEDFTPEQMNNLMFDLINGNLDDADKLKAEEAIRNFQLEILELTPETVKKPKMFRRAFEAHEREWFEFVEDTIEIKIDDFVRNHPLIAQFAEYLNLNETDRMEFYITEKTRLTVARVSGDHHDLTLQYFKEPTSFTVPLQKYAIKIGDDIRQYLLGRKSLAEQIAAVAEAFEEKIAADIVAAITGIGSKLPANTDMNVAITMPAAGNSTAAAAVIDQIVDVIDKVKSVNNAAGVVIMGMRTAIRKLERLQDIDWLAEEAKTDKYRTGRIAYFDEARLYEVPQRYKEENNKLEKLLPDNFLMIVPTGVDKFIKVINSGDTTIVQRNEIADYMDDLATYEVQKGFGVAAIVKQYVGFITLS